MIKDQDYWTQWYAQNKTTTWRSPFALFCKDLFVGKEVIDAGCGNGRDGHWFISQGYNVRSFDSVQSDAPGFQLCDISTADYSNAENVYARWVLHALDQESASAFLRVCHSGLVRGGKLFIECRSIDDGPIESTHYRRPINDAELTSELTKIGYVIEYSKVSRGWSVVGDDDPLLIRIVARKVI